jgi:SPP1 gp7 family putative phage head morphogenesis protein
MPDLEKWSLPHRAVDMKDWEVAINMANNIHRPDRSRLMDLYDSILVDSHLASVMESRVLRVRRSRFKLLGADGKSKPELLPLLEQRWFDQFLRFSAEAEFRGHTLIELSELVKPGQLKGITRIDPRNVLPWQGVVTKRQGEETGYKFREAPLQDYLIEVGQAEDLGLLSQVAPVAIVKKYCVGSWSDYVEKFGIPPRFVKTTSTDKVRVGQLEEMMQQMVSSAYAVIQSDEEITIMPSPKTDAHKVFDELISRMNSEMSKRVLGQDGTSDNKDATGTYGSLKVLAGVAEDRHQSDKANIAYLVNNELFPRLIKLGYPLSGIRFAWDELRDLSPGDLVDAVTKLGTIYDIDPEYVMERTGIKVTGIRRMPGEAAGGSTANPTKGAGRQNGDKASNTDPALEPDDEEDGATASWPQDRIALCAECGGAQHITAVAAPQVSTAALEQLLTDVHNGAKWSQPYFDEVSTAYVDGLLQQWGQDLVHLSYDAPDHVARTNMETNLFRFGAAKTLAIALDLNEHARDSTGFADFKRRVDESGLLQKYNRAWLEAEYVNAVNTGVQSSRWFQMQGSADALPYGEYITQQDDQVRPAHRVLHGKMWPLSDPIWGTIWPPNGWKCRCTVLPTQEGPEGAALKAQSRDVLEGLDLNGEMKKMKAGGFDKNRAIAGEVFPLNKAYKEQLGTAAGKAPTLGLRDSYGARAKDESWSALNDGTLPDVSSNTRTVKDAAQWFDTKKNADGVVVMKDHAGRPLRLNQATMDKKLRKEANRALLVGALEDAVANPDEVWLDVKGNLVYLKFTSAGVLRIPVAIDQEQGLRIRSFYLDTQDIDVQRAGLLIKKHRK